MLINLAQAIHHTSTIEESIEATASRDSVSRASPSRMPMMYSAASSSTSTSSEDVSSDSAFVAAARASVIPRDWVSSSISARMVLMCVVGVLEVVEVDEGTEAVALSS